MTRAPASGTARSRSGFALIIVMLVVVTLGALAAAFAYHMKIEATLARNSNSQLKLEWAARSETELVRILLAETWKLPEQNHNHDQWWAGGQYGTNDAILALQWRNGPKPPPIVDLESYFNINLADDYHLNRAMEIIQPEVPDTDSIIGAIVDWIDPDDDPGINGTESDFYLTMEQPYYAKNGPIDDMTELLKVRGVTHKMFWGTMAPQVRATPTQELTSPWTFDDDGFPEPYTNGLVQLFAPMSGNIGNLNTMSAEVMSLHVNVPIQIAQEIVSERRRSYDGERGTPFNNPAELQQRVPGITLEAYQSLSACGVRSATFRAYLDIEDGEQKGRWIALIRCDGPTNSKVLAFYEAMDWQRPPARRNGGVF